MEEDNTQCDCDCKCSEWNKAGVIADIVLTSMCVLLVVLLILK